MPFDTVGGLPPLPTQARGATLYHPRQPRLLMLARNAKRGGMDTADASPSALSRSPSPTSSDGRACGDGDYSGGGGGGGPLPPLPAPAPCHTDGAHPANPWRQRTTWEELEASQRRDPHGVAQFRPAVEPPPWWCRDEDLQAKPLLEPYLFAQNLAREATVGTWQVRRSRYLQWLRKGAATTRDDKDPHITSRAHSVYLGTTMATLARLGSGDEDTAGPPHPTTDAARQRAEHARHGTLSGAPPRHAPLSPAPRREASAVLVHPSGPMWRPESCGGGGDVLLQQCGHNASELAVQRLFYAARAAAVVAAGAAAPSSGADDLSSPVSVHSRGADRPRQPFESPLSMTGPGAALDRSPMSDVGSIAATAASGSLDNVFTPDATLALFGLDDTESDESGFSSNSKSTIKPPSEYDMAAVLRDRMHLTIATFTPSSRHTLDMPPLPAPARAFLGQTRLAANGAGVVRAAAARTDATPRTVQGLRRLFYEEEYERGLLNHLALQSAPTRWYSTEMPTGKEGIRFRLANPPAMNDDAVVQARLHRATQLAAETIAQPRRDATAAAAEEARKRARTLLPDKTSIDVSLCGGGGDDGSDLEARFTVERAAAEKALIFQKWTRLHGVLAAQLRLVVEESQRRRELLGEFLSCNHPAPCLCLDCDLDVLATSAVPLEPTVRPACWLASVVLARHRDTLQQEMLARYHAEHTRRYGIFKVEFSVLYSYEALVAEEARRFAKMLDYHEFCLRIAATGAASRPAAQARVHADTPPPSTPPEGATVTYDARMWRLRQRRLRYCAAFDSPFFSYLLYTEMLTVSAAEEEVRVMMVACEAEERAALREHMVAEEVFARLREQERRTRAWIVVEVGEVYNAMYAGPLVRLHAAHVAEVRAAQAAAYAKTCEAARQSFVAAAVAEKASAAAAMVQSYRPWVRELRQRFLTLLVADRNAAQSSAVSREWLNRQQHMSLFGSEQRLRDRVALVDEATAFAELMESAKVSLQGAHIRESHRLNKEAVRARKAAQRAAEEVRLAQEREEAVLLARLRREERVLDPSKRPSTQMSADEVNGFATMAMALEEDFDVFLPHLGDSGVV